MVHLPPSLRYSSNQTPLFSRSRKIRCDSTRPVCNNCVRRSNECEYDAVPKRRGPDKRPGTRQRSCKKRPADGTVPPPPKRKRVTSGGGVATPPPQVSQADLAPTRVKENFGDANSKRVSAGVPLSRYHVDHHHHNHHVQSSDLRDRGGHFKVCTVIFGRFITLCRDR